jgi:uncharacterized protein (TIGR00369 family)
VKEIEQRVRESFGRQKFMVTLGAEMTSVERGKVEIRLPFRSEMTQQNGFVHAGVITSILDSACGYAALSVAPEHCEVLSVEFKISLLAPAAGEKFVARGEVKRAGKTLSFCAGEAFAVQDGKEKLIANMLATIMNMPARR